MTLKWIVQRVRMGTWTYVSKVLRRSGRDHEKRQCSWALFSRGSPLFVRSGPVPLEDDDAPGLAVAATNPGQVGARRTRAAASMTISLSDPVRFRTDVMRRHTRFLMMLLWAGVFPVSLVVLMLCTQMAVMSTASNQTVREIFVCAFAISPLLGFALAALGLLPGTRRNAKVFVRTFSNGTTTLVPVNAERVGPLVFRILSTDTYQGNLTWEFWQGDAVRCEPRVAKGGEEVLVAVERVA